jgi:hypothetical protein
MKKQNEMPDEIGFALIALTAWMPFIIALMCYYI